MAKVVCSPFCTLRSIYRLVIVLIAIGTVPAALSAQTTVTLSTPGTHITDDMTIQGGSSGMVDFSSSDALASKVSSPDYTRRFLLKIDTQNYFPANVPVQSAYLYLTLKKAESSENRPLTAFYVNRSFVKYETNWYYYRSGQAWSTAGGDLGGNFGTTYVGGSVGTTYRFDVTNLVQRTVNGEFGSRYTRIAIVDTGGNTSGNYREFHSTRSSNSGARPRLVITYGGSSSPTTAPAPAPTPPPPSGTTLRVMQWNIKKTKGSDGACSPDRITNAIVAQNVHVVSLNEVNFYSGVCAYTFDMGAHLQSLMQQKTGVTWYKQHVNVYGGTNGYGNVILSRYPPVASGSTLLSNSRGVAEMTINVNGRNVTLFSTHVDYDSYWRPIQISEAMRWLGNFGEPRIMMGDFNTWPNTNEYYSLASAYQDAWLAGVDAGTASSFNGTGATRGDSRLDYVFYSRVSALALTGVKVPDVRVNGVYPSDHEPIVAVFTVR